MRRAAKMLGLMMVLVLLLGLTVQASSTTTNTSASSSSSSVASAYANVSVASSGGVVIDGVAQDVTVNVAPVTEAKKNEAQAQAAALIAPTAQVLQIVDISLPGTSYTKVQLTMNVAGVIEGQNLLILHQNPDGTWEVIIPDAVGNGTVTATFGNLSPVAIVAYNVSAKTADSMSWMPALAVLCLVGAFVCSKKAKRV